MTTPFVDSTIKFHALELLRALQAKEDYLFDICEQDDTPSARRTRLEWSDAVHATLNLKQVLVSLKIIPEL
jgi:hypothetical protein